MIDEISQICSRILTVGSSSLKDFSEMVKCLYDNLFFKLALGTSTRAFVDVNILGSLSTMSQKELSLLSFVNSDSLRDFAHDSRARPSTTLKVSNSSGSAHLLQQKSLTLFLESQL
jgi:hypothetical protein